jgi:hypothetical protein
VAIVVAQMLVSSLNRTSMSPFIFFQTVFLLINMQVRQWSEKLTGRCDWTPTLITLFRLIVAGRSTILHITAILGHLRQDLGISNLDLVS